MKTITTHEAKTHLSRFLAEVEKGGEFYISRGKKAVAKLVPISNDKIKPRPQVGEILGELFEFPDSAFAPLTKKQLREWGL